MTLADNQAKQLEPQFKGKGLIDCGLYTIKFLPNECQIYSVEHNGTKILIDDAAKQFKDLCYSYRFTSNVIQLCDKLFN